MRLETAKHRQYRYSYHADNLTGDVGPQWNNLYFRAGQEVKLLCLASGGCDRARKSDICDLIFSNNSRAIEDKLMLMQAKEVDETIHLLYKILYYDWLEGELFKPRFSTTSIIPSKIQLLIVNTYFSTRFFL